jgi:hypothetical protein
MKMKNKFVMMVAASAVAGTVSLSSAIPAPGVQFQDGNVLNIQGVYGSGADAAYLAVDFSAANASYAWQYNFNPSPSVNAFEALEAIAGESILNTSGQPGTNTVDNASGDPNLTVTATYYASYSEHLIDQIQYGSLTGSNYFSLYYGPYSVSNLSSSEPQGVNWTYSEIGIDDVALSNGEVIGFTDASSGNPILPETSVPEPASAGLAAGMIGGAFLVFRRRRMASAA